MKFLYILGRGKLGSVNLQNNLLPRTTSSANGCRGTWTPSEVINGDRLDPFELSAFERAVMTTKSVLLATRLVMEYTSPEKCEGRYGVEGISHLASLEVRFQTSMWWEVEDSLNPPFSGSS